MTAKHIFVTGRVQGVGYRRFTQIQADSLHLVGWVRNTPDGRVEISVAGEDARVTQFIEKLRKGPTLAHVEDLSVKDETETVDSDEFVIL